MWHALRDCGRRLRGGLARDEPFEVWLGAQRVQVVVVAGAPDQFGILSKRLGDERQRLSGRAA